MLPECLLVCFLSRGFYCLLSLPGFEISMFVRSEPWNDFKISVRRAGKYNGIMTTLSQLAFCGSNVEKDVGRRT